MSVAHSVMVVCKLYDAWLEWRQNQLSATGECVFCGSFSRCWTMIVIYICGIGHGFTSASCVHCMLVGKGLQLVYHLCIAGITDHCLFCCNGYLNVCGVCQRFHYSPVVSPSPLCSIVFEILLEDGVPLCDYSMTGDLLRLQWNCPWMHFVFYLLQSAYVPLLWSIVLEM